MKLDLSYRMFKERSSKFFKLHKHLEGLNLAFNRLVTLPPEIGQLQSLQQLNLRNNKLTVLPPEIGQLRSLQQLDLGWNQITALPPEIGQLQSLQELHLYCNQLTVLPPGIGQLQSLQQLNLYRNQITALPPEIGQLQSLQIIYSPNNRITALPPEIGQLQNLQKLNLSQNDLTALPPEIGHLHSLQQLDLSQNDLTALPPEIGQLKNLKIINLSNNPILDLSLLTNHPNQNLEIIAFDRPRKYWTHPSQWKAEWLLTEKNAELRRVLIQQIGYECLCEELGMIELDSWREYTLLKVDADVDIEPIHLLEMTCPSTNHIHLLRVPPDVTSARAAISWVNWDIDPEVFATET